MAGQLQAGGPALGPLDQGRDLVGAQRPAGDPLQESAPSRLVEGQLGLADLDHGAAQPVVAPGDGRVHPGGQDQVDLGREQVDEASQVGDEGGVGRAGGGRRAR